MADAKNLSMQYITPPVWRGVFLLGHIEEVCYRPFLSRCRRIHEFSVDDQGCASAAI